MKMNIETGNSGKIITHRGITPTIHESAFICDGVKIIGDVHIGKDASIWYNTVIRGDVNYIRIGDRTNIQDMVMIHVTNKKWPTILKNDVSIAHSATIHGAILNEFCLIGIGAMVLDGSEVGSNSLVAAGCVVREGFKVPEGVLIAGVPGKIIRDLKPEEIERVRSTPSNYMRYVDIYRQDKLDNEGKS